MGMGESVVRGEEGVSRIGCVASRGGKESSHSL